MTVVAAAGVTGGVGVSVRRPDGNLKVSGRFAFSSDLWAEGMIWGANASQPPPPGADCVHRSSPALQMAGVRCVLTDEDVPGEKCFGVEAADEPVLAMGEVRYQGEPIALVAADNPETARRAAASMVVVYEVRPPIVAPEVALRSDADRVHPDGNVVRHAAVRCGDPSVTPAMVTGTYEVGMQDHAFLGPESGLAVPAEDGGVDLYIATQWLHADQRQVAASLGLPADKVRLTLSGVGGAFGA